MPSMADRVTETTHVYIVLGSYDPTVRTDRVEIPSGGIGFFSMKEIIKMIELGEMTCACNIAAALLLARKASNYGLI